MAAWRSKLPSLQEDFLYTKLAEDMCLAQAPQRDADALIQALQKELTPKNPKLTNFNSTSQSRLSSKSLIDALADCFPEDTNLHPFIGFSEEQVVSTNTSFVSQSFSLKEGPASSVLEMESGASQSVGDFSNARGNAILTSTSTVRQSDFKNNVDFQASLGMHNLNKRVAMAASGACRPEFVDSHCVASTAIGTPPSSKTSALDTPTSLGAGGKRVGKKRTRASRRPPTTILEADSNNFRAMVQQLTGIPASPFFSPSLPRSRFEQLGSHLGGLVRPQSTSAAFPGQSSIPGLSMLDRALLQTANPTSLAHTSQAYTYGDILQSNEVTPFSFTLKQSSESQQLELEQPKSAMDFDKISEDSTKQLNSPSIFQSLGYSEAVALLSAKDQAPSLPADESHFWDSKADKSLRNISFNDLSKIKPVSVSKDTGCSEDQFYQKSMLDHLHGATDVDINSINNRTASPHIVDSWLSPAD